MPHNKSIVSMAEHRCAVKTALQEKSSNQGQNDKAKKPIQKSTQNPINEPAQKPVIKLGKKPARKDSKKPNSRVTFSQSKKKRFLRELSQSCNVMQSAEQVSVSVDTVYRHRKTDANFRREWAEAIEIAYDELMLEMLRRARFGTQKPIIYGGKQVGIFHDLNDAMAMRLLSMHMANVAQYKEEKSVDMNNDTHILLLNRLAEIKKRLQPPPEIKSASKPRSEPK